MKNLKLKVIGMALATAMIFGNGQVLASQCSESDALGNPETYATSIAVNQSVHVSLSEENNDLELYKLVPETSGIYTITLIGLESCVNPPLVFISPADRFRASDHWYDSAIAYTELDTETGTVSPASAYLTAGETYYIGAWTENSYVAADYSFVISDRGICTVYDYDRESGEPASSSCAPANIYWFDEVTVSQYIIPASDLEGLTGCELKALEYYYRTSSSLSYDAFEPVDDEEVHVIDNEYTQYSFDEDGVLTTCPVNVYLKEVDSEEFGEGFWEVEESDIVYNGVLTLSNGAMKIELDSPYVYNGGNLLVGIGNPEAETYASIDFYGQRTEYYSCVYGYNSGWSTLGFIPTTTVYYNIPNGWQNVGGQWMYFSDNVAATGWKQLNNRWYFFNDFGIMQTGWLKSPGNGKWYYLHPTDGYMMSSCWISSSNMWYYIGSDGLMVTGWQKIGNSWYYFNPIGGAMMKGWQKIGNNWYYLNPNGGAMVTGWQQISGSWYYMNSSGAMVTGWQKIGNTWYYFYSSGKMATGSVQIGSKTYQFASSGAWIPS